MKKLVVFIFLVAAVQAQDLRVAPFSADVSPKVGDPVAYVAARTILDPLSARGIVLLGAGAPVVLCAVDFIGIGNEGHDAWRTALAAAAGTTPDRVAVHTLHQHDAPRADLGAERYLAEAGLGGRVFKDSYVKDTVARAAAAVRAAVPKARRVTHVGVGQARVDKVASNRRILGPDGKVAIGRMSASRNPDAVAAPEGTIDPFLRLLSFWDGDAPIASLTYYATHPQSHYGKGDVTSEFVGLARAAREKELPGVAHIHFNGASGNVAAGKYNDGSPENRPVLTARMAAGMRQAWESQRKTPVSARDASWSRRAVRLPDAPHLDRQQLRKTLLDPDARFEDRRGAAMHLAWLDRRGQVDVTRLRFGGVQIVHLPGELFVEYQLAAQKMSPDGAVLLAAYGDYGPGYIGTAIAYTQGGYEVSPGASRVAPRVEEVLLGAMRQLLTAPQ